MSVVIERQIPRRIRESAEEAASSREVFEEIPELKRGIFSWTLETLLMRVYDHSGGRIRSFGSGGNPDDFLFNNPDPEIKRQVEDDKKYLLQVLKDLGREGRVATIIINSAVRKVFQLYCSTAPTVRSMRNYRRRGREGGAVSVAGRQFRAPTADGAGPETQITSLHRPR